MSGTRHNGWCTSYLFTCDLRPVAHTGSLGLHLWIFNMYFIAFRSTQEPPDRSQ
uniref:Uncharacterized protein n=1 Tax=Arundo donax TaxID=35708 RepID=A0A0A9F329_ARUDO